MGLMRAVISYLLICVFSIGSCQMEKPEKYVPASERNRIKYATPEPGTYLKPDAYQVLQVINRVMEEPESFEKPTEWVYRIFTPRMQKKVDTVFTYCERSIPVRIYYPTKKSLEGNQPLMLFIHGGGFSFGSVEEYDLMVGKLAKITGMIMVSVEYRLAPEHPFPAAVDDCYDVLCWLQENSAKIGGDKGSICVMGDSAGGNLATVLTLRCRDDHRPQPKCQVLIYPGVTFSDTMYASRVYFGLSHMRFVLDEAFLMRVRSDYMGEMRDVRNPYLSPLEADLNADLPPALVITAECDPIRDGGRDYAKKLKAAGVDVEHIEYSGMIHGFLSFHVVIRDAKAAMKYIRDYLDPLMKKTQST